MIEEHKGCCSHDISEKPSKLKALLWHPLMHTIKICIFLLMLTVLFGFVVEKVGVPMMGVVLLNGTVFQPFIAAFVGLIPNCFSSVLLAELYVKGAISFGSLIAGLSAGCGLGVLVLIKENSSLKDTLTIIGLLIGISIGAGVFVQAMDVIQ